MKIKYRASKAFLNAPYVGYALAGLSPVQTPPRDRHVRSVLPRPCGFTAYHTAAFHLCLLVTVIMLVPSYITV